MTKGSWEKLVAKGRSLVTKDGEIRWALGDLSLKIAPMGDDHSKNGATEKLRQFADEIDFEFEALDSYRKMSAKWPEGTRVPSCSWTAHRELIAHENRFKLLKAGMSSHDARRAAGKKARPGDPAPPVAMRVERVREYMADPKVARAALADPTTRTAVEQARMDVAEDEWARTREQDTTPVGREIEEAVFGRPAAEQRERERPHTFPERFWGNLVAAAQVIAIDWRPTQVKRLSREDLAKVSEEGRKVIETVEEVVSAAEETLERRAATVEERS